MKISTRSLIIIVAVILIIGVGALIFFGRKTADTGEPTFLGRLFPESETTPSRPPQGGVIPTPLEGVGGGIDAGTLSESDAAALPAGSLIRLSADAASSVAVSGTTTRYHKNIPENIGHLFERDADGSNEEARISNFTVPRILKVVWSPDSARAVIFYVTGNDIRKILVDYSEETPKTNFLPDSISAIAFSPNSQSVAYIDFANGAYNIYTASASFASPRLLRSNNVPTFEISWPSANRIALKTTSSHDTPGFLYLVNTASGALSKILESLGLDAVWNTDSSGIVFSDRNLNLTFLDIGSGEKRTLGIKTVAEKCVFSKETGSEHIVWCAIPKSVPGAIYPDDWWKGKVAFLDNLVAIDTRSLDIIFFASLGHDAVDPHLSSNDNYFIYRDRNTGELWSVKLK